MVLIFSASANDSPQIRREVERAVNKEVPILPFRIEAVEPTQSLEYFIGTLHWLDALSPPMDAHIARLSHTIKALLTVPSADPDAAETVAANTAPRRAHAYQAPAPVAPRYKNLPMWIVAGLGILAVTAIAIVWSGRKHETPPAAPAAPTTSAHIANVPHPSAVPGGAEKWTGVNYRAGQTIPDSFEMNLTIAEDGTINGSSTEVSIAGGMAPVRNAIVNGKLSGTNVTFTKNFGGSADAVEYRGVIDPEHKTMSGTWRHGNEQGTFTASTGHDQEDDEGDTP